MSLEHQLLVVGVAFFILLVLHGICSSIERLVCTLRYRWERKRFNAAVARGETPDWCPVEVSERGVWRIDPNDLVRTAGFKRQANALRELTARARYERIEGFETLYEGPRRRS
ncbi:MAG: hypothetical protein A3C93_01675 [Candidatus Lloydbacteria bacterium RIFCSPHIGHO2_02_FULL_54_17]|uniref:Uncharacterized protein n=1 Tax=Candidatus Lloydbacteria bacterium RIFCSPHIGHO2_02_FULL_54_17 TaxID=1798664 RepID=A0A1G2DC84_9BACT|nr:MAG: hypothetical protein A2762_02855 [Candidatus Lloydbacteria bacterium RIFCSPHIGHO2_01_FULL_54_11]OGZ11062.1 MAG: hypothetical protein A3C93_01675 [Candidatus Lloydbacteria bacterium RIFCSPHIGHO2_02_FULL_54_17]OGZ14461.1 MAG: hypothetical protein A3H76_06190 [Candidatus Lloydbacteria bacterium RIFCSPLOWO2_02_FULL_54_12]OGZ15477.1 MAG: hypothetical protein A2948_02795 [Candidatus Lloydbacteria bacterium RIFCSPLOWO2_01_FULL_54_18]